MTKCIEIISFSITTIVVIHAIKRVNKNRKTECKLDINISHKGTWCNSRVNCANLAVPLLLPCQWALVCDSKNNKFFTYTQLKIVNDRTNYGTILTSTLLEEKKSTTSTESSNHSTPHNLSWPIVSMVCLPLERLYLFIALRNSLACSYFHLFYTHTINCNFKDPIKSSSSAVCPFINSSTFLNRPSHRHMHWPRSWI